MKKVSYYILFMLSLLPVALTSCGSDDDSYSPGAEVSDDNPTVYFSKDNDSEIIVTDDENSVTLKLKRKNTEGNVTAQIVTDSKTGALNIPETVTFLDGEDEADLVITYDTFESGMKCSLHIADDYANPYLQLDGSINYSMSLVQINKVCDVKFWTSDGILANEEETIYAYAGENKFLWKDFLGSGTDLMFTVDTENTDYPGVFDANDITKLCGDFVPLSNYTTEETGQGWFFTNDIGSEDYVSWTIESSGLEVQNLFIWYHTSYSSSIIDFGSNTTYYQKGGMFYNCYLNDYSKAETIYFYLYY